jgi:hypothetical protein
MELAAEFRPERSAKLLPISFWQSVGYFGIPWLLFVINIHSRSTWPGIIAHLFNKLPTLIMIGVLR